MATVILLALLWLLRRSMRWLGRRIMGYADRMGSALRSAGTEILHRDHVMHWIRVGIRIVLCTLGPLITYE